MDSHPRWLSGLRRSRVHSLWLLVDHCVLRTWDRILVRAVKGLISRAGMVSICPLLWQRDVKLQQTNNHSNGHIETMPAREINPFTALTRIRSQFLRTQWSTRNHQRVDTTTPHTAQPSGLATHIFCGGPLMPANVAVIIWHLAYWSQSDFI